MREETRERGHTTRPPSRSLGPSVPLVVSRVSRWIGLSTATCDLQHFIMAHAAADFARGGVSADWDPTAEGLSSSQRYQRRVRNLKQYPHLVAHFFHLKTELYVEHICVGILKANAYWMRYEWQSRGSTHVHYFLWLQDAPEITSVLDRLTKQTAESMFTDKQELSEADLEQLVHALNERAQAPAAITRARQRGDTDATDAASEDDMRLAAAAEYWGERCTRWNTFWDEKEKKPNRSTDVGTHGHPCSFSPPSEELCNECKCADDAALIGDAHQSPPPPAVRLAGRATCCARHAGQAPPCKTFVDDLGALRNTPVGRHTTCGPYCLRERNGVTYCRFGFGTELKQPREVNDVPHFWCELVKNSVRWRLHLPTNDPLMGKQNMWQLASQRSNVDFSPLIDHSCAIEYITKYAAATHITGLTCWLSPQLTPLCKAYTVYAVASRSTPLQVRDKGGEGEPDKQTALERGAATHGGQGRG